MRVVYPPTTVRVADLKPVPRGSRLRRPRLPVHPFDADQFRSDIRSILTGRYKLEDGRKVKGEAVSHALKTMRGYGRSSDLKSGRCWHGFSSLGDFESKCEEVGFTIRRGHGYRVYHGGVMRYGAKARVIFEGKPLSDEVVNANVAFASRFD